MATTEHIAAVVEAADGIVGDALTEVPAPGLGVGIVHRGELVYAGGFGAADIDAGRSVDRDTIFRIGSISKTFVAVAIMQLRDRGLLELDDPLERHLTDWRIEPAPGSEPITLRHLLTHTSGIGEIRALSDAWRPGGRLKWDPDKGPVPDLPTFYGGGFQAEVPVGTKWAYANHAYGTLGHVVETVSGEPFAAYMIDNVFTPLGMDHSDFLRSDRVEDRLAVGYGKVSKKPPEPVDYHEIVIPGAGSIFSSVRDMGRYVAAITGGGANDHGRVLKEDSFAELLRPHWRLDGRLPFRQGLAFMIGDVDGHRVVHHGGGWHGFISFLMAAPDDDLGVVAFANSASMAPYEVTERLLFALLDAPDPRDGVPVPGLREPVEVWPDLVGAYGPAPGFKTNFRFHGMFAGQLDILVNDGHLAARGLVGSLGKPTRLYPLDPDDPLRYRGVVEVEGRRQLLDIAFVREPDGTVQTVNLELLLPMQAHRRPAFKDLRKIGKGAAGLAGLGALGWWVKRRFTGEAE